MNRISLVFAASAVFCLNMNASGQAPGGVSTGLTAWYHAEAGTTVTPANVLTSWANQVTNANLTNLTADGGATTIVSNNPVPFNFHSYLQHAAGCMRLANSVTNTDVVTTTQGSMMGVGTVPDQLICLTGNSTSGQFGNNRANTGTRGNRTEFGSGTTNGGANFATGTILNTGNANIFGLRALAGATPAQQNTYNGLKATGAAATRPAGSYRFAIGSFTGQATSGGSMTANVTGGLAPINYQWNTTPPQTTATATGLSAGNYIVTITQAAGCAYAKSATVSNDVIELMASLTAIDVKCNGDANGSITVANTNGTPAYAYSLNNQSDWVASNQFNNLSAGFYRVFMKDANGCMGNDTITIKEPERLSLQFKNLIDDYCELGTEPNGNVEVLLTGGTVPYTVTLNGSNIGPSSKLSGLKEGNYTYAVTDANGCTIYGNFSIEHVPCCLVFVPNAFTPNADGRNDVFEMRSEGRIRLNKMLVYNRYGQIVWGTFNQGEGWDGTMNGKPVDAGTYFYYLKYTCESFNGPKETELKGDVTVVR